MRSNLKNKKELNVWLRIVLIFIAYIVVFIGTAIIFNAQDREFWKLRIASTALKIFMCITVILFTIYVDKKQIEYCPVNLYYLLKFNESPKLLVNGVNLGEQMELVFVVIEILLLVFLKYYNCKKTSSTYSNNIINVK